MLLTADQMNHLLGVKVFVFVGELIQLLVINENKLKVPSSFLQVKWGYSRGDTLDQIYLFCNILSYWIFSLLDFVVATWQEAFEMS